MTVAEEELEYYRRVEDLFAELRGVPHLFSPADFQLLREWWRERVPLTAVRAGIAEAVARRRERGEDDPVSSLRYCRHAVRRHAKRLAAMRVGESPAPSPALAPEQVTELAQRVEACSRRHEGALARAILSAAASVRAAAELPPEGIEPHLFDLEAALLARCLEALEPALRAGIESEARAAATASGAAGEALERTFRAHRDRLLRARLELPRLELTGWS